MELMPDRRPPYDTNLILPDWYVWPETICDAVGCENRGEFPFMICFRKGTVYFCADHDQQINAFYGELLGTPLVGQRLSTYVRRQNRHLRKVAERRNGAEGQREEVPA